MADIAPKKLGVALVTAVLCLCGCEAPGDKIGADGDQARARSQPENARVPRRGSIAPLPVQHSRAYPETVTGVFISLVDFEDDASGGKGFRQVRHFSVSPAGRGKVLRIRTNIERDKWLEYRRKLRFGQADPKHPPKLKEDSSYGSLAGLEGVHYRSDWLPAKPNQRYWLVTDMKSHLDHMPGMPNKEQIHSSEDE